ADQRLLQKIRVDFDIYNYVYDKNSREVVRFIEKEVVFVPDSTVFDPERIGINSETCIYRYSRPRGTFGQFVDELMKLVELVVNPLNSFNNNKEEVEITVKQKGSIDIIPTLHNDGAAYYLYYYYESARRKLFYEIVEEDIALKIKFNGKEPLICFLNETVFTQSTFDYFDDQYSNRRAALINDFKRIIIAPVERDFLSNSSSSYYEALVTLSYLMDKIALTLNSDGLWSILEYVVKNDNLANNLNLEKEAVLVKLLVTIAKNERDKKSFLVRLLKKRDVNITYLEFLSDKLHRENRIAFCDLVTKAWKESTITSASATNPRTKCAVVSGMVNKLAGYRGRDFDTLLFLNSFRLDPSDSDAVVNEGAEAIVNGECPRCKKLTMEELTKVFRNASEEKKTTLMEAFNKANTKFGLNTCQQKAHFFAQVMEEVGSSINIKDGEGLNYAAEDLPKHFSRFRINPAKDYNKDTNGPNSLAYQYGRSSQNRYRANQEMIANIAYANKEDNGDVASGDGWKYRGRGILQITYKRKYTKVNRRIRSDYPEFTTIIDANNINNLNEGTVASIAYWEEYKCQQEAEKGYKRQHLDAVVNIINRGTRSRDNRWENLKKCIDIFKVR
ncbi:MAG TPA: hypothetical protein VF691_07825, partial [Cytophagaceae bacterium]